MAACNPVAGDRRPRLPGTADLETLLTGLYVLIDDHVIPAVPRQPGRPKKLSDAELVCLAVAQALLGAWSEHHWLLRLSAVDAWQR